MVILSVYDNVLGKYVNIPIENDRLSFMRYRLMKVMELFDFMKTHFNLNVLMITLTIANKEDEDEAIEDFPRFRKRLYERFRRRGFKIYGSAWVIERQKRGVIHYHLVILTDLNYSSIPEWLKPDLGMWNFGLSRVERVRKSVRNYLSKYLSKENLDLKYRNAYYCRINLERIKEDFGKELERDEEFKEVLVDALVSKVRNSTVRRWLRTLMLYKNEIDYVRVIYVEGKKDIFRFYSVGLSVVVPSRYTYTPLERLYQVLKFIRLIRERVRNFFPSVPEDFIQPLRI